MTKYTREVEAAVHTMKAPYPGLVIDVVEYKDYLALRFYRDNVNSFSDPKKIELAQHLVKLQGFIRNLGVKCYIEGEESVPPNTSTIGRGKR